MPSFTLVPLYLIFFSLTFSFLVLNNDGKRCNYFISLLEVKTILKKTVNLETKRYDFDNEFAYIEQWRNTILTDCYFVEKQYLFPDGSIKAEGKKYFYSALSGDAVEKTIKIINLEKFNWFDKLYYIDEEGAIRSISSQEG